MRRKYSEKVFTLLNSVSKYYIHQSLFSQEKHYRHGNQTVPSNKAEVVIVAPDKLMLILHKILTPLPKTSNRLILLFV